MKREGGKGLRGPIEYWERPLNILDNGLGCFPDTRDTRYNFLWAHKNMKKTYLQRCQELGSTADSQVVQIESRRL